MSEWFELENGTFVHFLLISEALKVPASGINFYACIATQLQTSATARDKNIAARKGPI
jgi:hypothetical protein